MYGLKVISTVGILLAVAEYGRVENRLEMKSVYESIAQIDDGIPGWGSNPARNPLTDKTIYLAHKTKHASNT